MKKLFLLTALVLASAAAFADQVVQGYTRSNGTYVNSYVRSDANNTVTDNYSFKGNNNPYTGSTGSNSYQHDTTSPYFNGTSDSNGQFGHSNNNGFGNQYQ